MKKTQIALAALALVASSAAMAEVKMSGQIDLGVGHYTGKGSMLTKALGQITAASYFPVTKT